VAPESRGKRPTLAEGGTPFPNDQSRTLVDRLLAVTTADADTVDDVSLLGLHKEEHEQSQQKDP
jgi:hypothetical protein